VIWAKCSVCKTVWRDTLCTVGSVCILPHLSSRPSITIISSFSYYRSTTTIYRERPKLRGLQLNNIILQPQNHRPPSATHKKPNLPSPAIAPMTLIDTAVSELGIQNPDQRSPRSDVADTHGANRPTARIARACAACNKLKVRIPSCEKIEFVDGWLRSLIDMVGDTIATV
jgi:hypothetical protein